MSRRIPMTILKSWLPILLLIGVMGMGQLQTQELFAQEKATEKKATEDNTEAKKAEDPPKEKTKEPATGEPATPPKEGTVTLEKVEQLKAADLGKIAPDVKEEITQLYTTAIERLRQVEQLRQEMTQLSAEAQNATADQEKLQKELVQEEPPLPKVTDELKLEEIQTSLTDVEQELAKQMTSLQEIEAEILKRTERRKKIPALLVESKRLLEDLKTQLKAPPPEGESIHLGQARKILIETRIQYRQQEIATMEQEARTYETASRVWSIRRDLAARRVAQLERKKQFWQEALAKVQQEEAQQQVSQAKKTAATVHPEIRALAEKNTQLAEDNARFVAELEDTRKEVLSLTEKADELQNRFTKIRNRAEAAQYSQAIGVLLRNQKQQLPDLETNSKAMRNRQKQISQLNLEIIELGIEKQVGLDTESQIESLMKGLSDDLRFTEKAEIEQELEEILKRYNLLLSELIDNAQKKLDRLVALQSAESRYVNVVKEQADYIAEHILWVRSETPLNWSILSDGWVSARWLMSSAHWKKLGSNLKSDVLSSPWIWSGCVLALLALIIRRRRLKLALVGWGQQAARPMNVEFVPTLKAVAVSLLLAVTFPGILALFGWRLTDAAVHGSWEMSLGRAIVATAGVYFVLEVLRIICRTEGLGTAHFSWPKSSLRSLRTLCTYLLLATLPFVFVVVFAETTGDQKRVAGLGRLAFLLAMGNLAIGLFRTLKPSGGIMTSLPMKESERSFLTRTAPVWGTVLMVSPLILIGLSVAGYHYTAYKFSERLILSLSLIGIFLVIRSLLLRWALISYRRLRINRLREQRSRLAQKSEGDEQQIAVTEESQVKLSNLSEHTHKLIGLVTGGALVLCLIFVWMDVLPALGILREIHFWENALVPEVDGKVVYVTLVEISVAILILLITFLASRDLPGLLEMLVLSRLPLDAGARYATSAITRYCIVALGIIFCFRQIGVGWESVQWLLAAMTVGLGFGLQEIFANFVSGVILLFERPIRVGDTVTIEEITGTVTRIRIRATTILDWDNKELVIPNRAFVTGNLVNWTLSNTNLRIILGVGVAYGSNTRLATKLLLEVADECPSVLKEPEPVVVFHEFGSSSLNFELRLYVTGLTAYRRLKHDLNLSIDDKFREHGIEIAFPQQDLHIRSVSPEALKLPNSPEQEPDLYS